MVLSGSMTSTRFARAAMSPTRRITSMTRAVCKSIGTFGSDRKSVVQGKSVSVRVDLGGRRIIKKKNKINRVKHECSATQDAQLTHVQTDNQPLAQHTSIHNTY